MLVARKLICDAWIIAHIARHGVTPEAVDEACHGEHSTRETYGGRLLVISPTRHGRLLAIVLADLAQGKLRSKRDQLAQALAGRLRPHHQFLLSEHLAHLDYLDEAIARFSANIPERLQPHTAETARLATIPGVSQRTAEILVAEIGTDMRRFPSARHLASWASMCPGNNESAGKRRSGKTRKGSRWLRQVLIEAAHAAARTKDTYLSAQYHRLAARRGTKRGLVALGHTILVMVYHVLSRGVPYHELGVTPSTSASARRSSTGSPIAWSSWAIRLPFSPLWPEIFF
jgi:transposase